MLNGEREANRSITGESQRIGLGLEEKQSASQVMIKIRSLTTSVKTLHRAAPADGNLNYAVKKNLCTLCQDSN